MRSPLETTGNSKIPFNLKEKNCTTSWLTSRDSRDSRVIQGLIIQGFAKHITLCSRRCIMYRIWSPSARNEWHPGSNQHRKCWIIWMQKGSSRRPNQQSAATRAQSIPFHSYSSGIHQVFIRLIRSLESQLWRTTATTAAIATATESHHVTSELRIHRLIFPSFRGMLGCGCGCDNLTSDQSDQSDQAGSWMGSTWSQHGATFFKYALYMINMEQIFHRSHEKSGEYQHSWYQLIYTSSMKKSPIMIWSNGPRG